MAGVFAQDDWEVRRGLTLNVGLRWDKDSLFQGDNNNFAPRVGFAWNVGRRRENGHPRQHRHLLRHARVVRDQPRVEHRPGRPDDDRSARRAIRCFPTFPNRLSAFPSGAATVRARAGVRAGLPGRRFPAGSIGATSSSASAPYFFNTNLGVQHELGPDWAVSADYTRVYGYDLLVTWDINAPPFFALGPGQTRTVAQANALRPLGVPNRTGGRLRHPVHRLPQPVPAVQRRAHRVQRAEVRRDQAHVAPLCAAGELHARPGARRRRQLPAEQSFVPGLTALDGDRSYQWGPSDTDVRTSSW